MGSECYFVGDAGGEDGEGAMVLRGVLPPPLDKEGEAQRLLSRAMKAQPDGTKLLVLGDLNADLDVPRTTQEDVLAAEMTELGLTCASRHYVSASTRHVRGRWTFHQPSYTPEGGRRWMWGKPDYALMRKEDRKRLRSCRWLLA